MTVIFIILGIIALILLIALFVGKSYVIQREIVINKPVEIVFDYVKQLKNQDHYSKWVMTDPNMDKEFRGTDGTVGFVYAWNGNKQAGKGEQEIKGIEEGRRVDVEVRFEKPMATVAQTPIAVEPVSENATRVTWSMIGKNKYPMNLMNLFLSNLLGKDMDQSLLTLKTILEKS